MEGYVEVRTFIDDAPVVPTALLRSFSNPPWAKRWKLANQLTAERARNIREQQQRHRANTTDSDEMSEDSEREVDDPASNREDNRRKCRCVRICDMYISGWKKCIFCRDRRRGCQCPCAGCRQTVAISEEVARAMEVDVITSLGCSTSQAPRDDTLLYFTLHQQVYVQIEIEVPLQIAWPYCSMNLVANSLDS